MNRNRALAAAAAALALAALVAGDRPAAAGGLDLDRLARLVEDERDHIDALDLARWIRDARPGLRIVDVRPRELFDEYHLPNAEHIPVGDIPRARFAPGETVVLYSDAGPHAAQAWFFLQARGFADVYFLRGGLYEWIDEVMEPRLPDDPTPEQAAAFEKARELSAYFGGMPAVLPRPDEADHRHDRVRRRTC